MTDLTSIIVKCMNFAAIKHKNQRRKDPDKTPYINHPIGEFREQKDVTPLIIMLSEPTHPPTIKTVSFTKVS